MKRDNVSLPKIYGTNKKYLPIEFLKPKSRPKFLEKKYKYRSFLSSGTSSTDRAESHFSREGLLLYKEQSLEYFSRVISSFFSEHQNSFQAFSFIPSNKIWKDSSLSQMITWFEEKYPIKYINNKASNEDIKSELITNKPIWIFATAFHLIQAFDHGLSLNLPQGSVVFETGGTKGKSREMARKEYYELISRKLNIPENSIISEYSMSEIACQAYDWVNKDDQKISIEKRYFRFPKYVKVSIMKAGHKLEKEGIGSLVIDDPKRIDYPWPLRTQDIVKLKPDGSFKLLRRLPKAPLKGCSILAEEITTKDKKEDSIKNNNFNVNYKAATKQLKPVQLESILSDNKALQSLAQELGSQNAAKKTLKELLKSLPKDRSSWEKTLLSSKLNKHDRWLLIAPSNHSIATLEVLFVAVYAGTHIFFRLPKELEKNSLISFILEKLKERQANITILPHSFRIEEKKPLNINANKIMLWGDDSTIKKIAKICTLPIRSFGSGIGVSYINKYNKKIATQIAHDTLGLAQKGCRSTRLLYFKGAKNDLIKFIPELNQEMINYWQAPFDEFNSLALDHEELRYDALSAEWFFTRKKTNDSLFPSYKFNKDINPITLISKYPFTLPIIYDYNLDINRDPFIQSSYVTRFHNTNSQEYYTDNTWNGTYQGTPLFMV